MSIECLFTKLPQILVNLFDSECLQSIEKLKGLDNIVITSKLPKLAY